MYYMYMYVYIYIYVCMYIYPIKNIRESLQFDLNLKEL